MWFSEVNNCYDLLTISTQPKGWESSVGVCEGSETRLSGERKTSSERQQKDCEWKEDS